VTEIWKVDKKLLVIIATLVIFVVLSSMKLQTVQMINDLVWLQLEVDNLSDKII